MKNKELGDCARQLLNEVATVHSMDVVLKSCPPGQNQAREVRLRVAVRPDKLSFQPRPNAMLLPKRFK